MREKEKGILGKGVEGLQTDLPGAEPKKEKSEVNQIEKSLLPQLELYSNDKYERQSAIPSPLNPSNKWPPSGSFDRILENRGYKLISNLGEGSYAKVKKGQSARHNCQVAIKVIDQSKVPREFREKFLPRELKLHQFIDHPNVIRLLDLFRISNRIYMVMELAGHGDILDFVRLRGAIVEGEVKTMFRQVLEAISHLHTLGIVHRDLKCENLLLDIYNNVKLSDFGFARTVESDTFSSTYCGSAAYAAPEILKGIPYAPAMYDMWSLGVILFILVNGTMPFDDSNLRKMVKHQEAKRIPFVKDRRLSPEVKELILRLLEPSVKDRASTAECIDSNWLRDTPYTVNDCSVSKSVVTEPLTTALMAKPGERFKRKKDQSEPATPTLDPKTLTAEKAQTSGLKDNGKAPAEVGAMKDRNKKKPRPPIQLPAGFVASSTRRLFRKGGRRKSETEINPTDPQTAEVLKPVKGTVVKPTPSSMPSEISYYDTEKNVKKTIRANAFI